MSALSEVLGWALVHAVWQGCLLALAAAWFGLFLRGRLRHAVDGLCLTLCLLLPAATAWRGHRIQPPGQALVQMSADPNPVSAPPLSASASEGPPLRVRFERAIQAHLSLLVALWAIGACAMALRMGGGYVLCLRWKRQAQEAPLEWQRRLEDLARRLALARPVRLRLTRWGSTPLAMGLWKPVVLLPAALLTFLPPAYLEALLAHELAHVRRWDFLASLLQGLAETLLFFHPAVWWLSNRIRAGREHLADDLAARCLGDPRRLALALNALDDFQPAPTPFLFPALAARGGPLLTRIERLIAPPKPSALPSWGLLPLLLAPCAALALRAVAPEPPPIAVPAELVAQVDALAAQEKLDLDLLRSMAWVESGFDPRAKSPRGAMGLLQVMPETAKRFGARDLEDPAQVAAAGAKYLRFLLDRYHGDVKRAVAAYNCGEEALDAGRTTPEAVRYQSLVMEVLDAKAVRPEAPLGEGEVAGVIRRAGAGVWIFQNRVSTTGGFTLEVLPAPGPDQGKAKAPFGTVQMGSQGQPAGPWQTFQPKARIEIPEGTHLVLRCTDSATGRTGEGALTLAGPWQSFRFRMEAPKP